jgi:hypothetical protein
MYSIYKWPEIASQEISAREVFPRIILVGYADSIRLLESTTISAINSPRLQKSFKLIGFNMLARVPHALEVMFFGPPDTIDELTIWLM